MIIETKFDIGDKIYAIMVKEVPVVDNCAICKGDKRIKIEEKSFTCPECYGSGNRHKDWVQEWKLYSDMPMTVGQVRTENSNDGKVVQYMLKETGIGTGTLWKETILFATKGEAIAVCSERNSKRSGVEC